MSVTSFLLVFFFVDPKKSRVEQEKFLEREERKKEEIKAVEIQEIRRSG